MVDDVFAQLDYLSNVYFVDDKFLKFWFRFQNFISISCYLVKFLLKNIALVKLKSRHGDIDGKGEKEVLEDHRGRRSCFGEANRNFCIFDTLTICRNCSPEIEETEGWTEEIPKARQRRHRERQIVGQKALGRGKERVSKTVSS